MDPCLDDCIMMAKRLKSLGMSVGLDVLPGLPHGFLSFVKVNSIKYTQSTVSNGPIFHVVFQNSYQKRHMKAIVCAFPV